MKPFAGFPTKMQFTAVPNVFFSSLLPDISDITELKTTLHILGMLYRKRSYPRFITFNELLGNKSLMSSLKVSDKSADDVLRGALEMALKRGTILQVNSERDGAPEPVYFLNTDTDKKAIARIQSGEMSLPGLKTAKREYVDVEEQPDLFTLYEQNVGMLTPMIAEELREAERLFPEDWIKDAIREAVSLNKRSWRYIARILERWSSEGRSNGTYRRDFKETDADKYLKQKYGNIVRR